MYAVRIAGLIALMLVASTLQAHAWPTAPPDDAQKHEAPCDQTPSGEPDGEEDDSPCSLKPAPNADVWDGSSARTSSTGTPSLVVASLLGRDPGSRISPASPDTFVRVEAQTPSERPQRRWLICRYAHAPPVGA